MSCGRPDEAAMIHRELLALAGADASDETIQQAVERLI